MLRRDHHLIREGQVILGDKGFAGGNFDAFITKDLGATLIRLDRKDEKPRFGNFGGIWHNWRINAPLKRSLIAYDH